MISGHTLGVLIVLPLVVLAVFTLGALSTATIYVLLLWLGA